MANYDKSLSGEHISANLASYEAARSGFFTLIVSDIDSLLRASYSGEEEAATDKDRTPSNSQEILKLNVVKCPIPHFSVDTHQYKRGNDTIKFAGVPTFKSGSIVVDDVVGLDTKSILMAWQNQVYNVHTRRGGRMANYKKTATLCEYTQDFELIRSWTIYGMFLTELSEDDFDKETDGKRQITATFEYDRAEMVMPEEES